MADSKTNLFVANLSYDVDDPLFLSTFEKFGEIRSAKVMLDIHTGISRGFGFVMFVNEDSANAAMDTLQGQPIGQRQSKMSISWAKTSGKSAVTATTKLYVRNVPKFVDEATLTTLFNSFGKVVRSVVKEDTADKTTLEQRGQSNWLPNCCVIFLEYATVKEATDAVNGMHNTRPWPNMTAPLMAKTAETAEMRNIRKLRQTKNVVTQQPKPNGTMPGMQPGVQAVQQAPIMAVQQQQVPLMHSQGQPMMVQAGQQAMPPPPPQMWQSNSASMSSSWGPNQLGQLLPVPQENQPQQLVVVPANMVLPNQGPQQQMVIAQPPQGNIPTQYCVLPQQAPLLFDQSLDQSFEQVVMSGQFNSSASPKGNNRLSRSESPGRPARPQSPLVPSLDPPQ